MIALSFAERLFGLTFKPLLRSATLTTGGWAVRALKVASGRSRIYGRHARVAQGKDLGHPAGGVHAKFAQLGAHLVAEKVFVVSFLRANSW